MVRNDCILILDIKLPVYQYYSLSHRANTYRMKLYFYVHVRIKVKMMQNVYKSLFPL